MDYDNGIFRKWLDSYITKQLIVGKKREGEGRGEGDRKTEKGKKGKGARGVRRKKDV